MTEPRDNPLTEHERECEECRAAALPIAELSELLGRGAAPVDPRPLSALALARVAPALQGRAQAVFWRRLVRALSAALLPLPLLIAADWWLLGRLYDVAAAWLPSAVAAYLTGGADRRRLRRHPTVARAPGRRARRRAGVRRERDP